MWQLGQFSKHNYVYVYVRNSFVWWTCKYYKGFKNRLLKILIYIFKTSSYVCTFLSKWVGNQRKPLGDNQNFTGR